MNTDSTIPFLNKNKRRILPNLKYLKGCLVPVHLDACVTNHYSLLLIPYRMICWIIRFNPPPARTRCWEVPCWTCSVLSLLVLAAILSSKIATYRSWHIVIHASHWQQLHNLTASFCSQTRSKELRPNQRHLRQYLLMSCEKRFFPPHKLIIFIKEGKVISTSIAKPGAKQSWTHNNRNNQDDFSPTSRRRSPFYWR